MTKAQARAATGAPLDAAKGTLLDTATGAPLDTAKGTLLDTATGALLDTAMGAPFDAADVLVRPVEPADADRLRAFYAELSPRSRRLRFLGGGPRIGSAGWRAFCTPDHLHAEGFVAESLPRPEDAGCTVTAPDPDGGPILAHLCLEPDGAGGTEFAVAVMDPWQGRGIGRRLMERALAWAAAGGIETLSATALATNVGLHRLVRGIAPDALMLGRADGVIDIVIRVACDVPSGPRKGAVGPITRRRRHAILGA